MTIFAESMDAIVRTHQRVAEAYFRDGGVDLAIPPLRGLLEIMAYGKTSAGWTLSSPDFRALFTRELVLASDWYAARLDAKQRYDVAHLRAGLAHLRVFADAAGNDEVCTRLRLDERTRNTESELARICGADYRAQLVGTIGRQVDFG